MIDNRQAAACMAPTRRSVPPPDAARLTTLRQLGQCHITDGIYSVVVFIFWLVCGVAVTVFRPTVRPCIADDTLRPPREMYLISPQDVKTANDAVRSLRAGRHPQVLRLQLLYCEVKPHSFALRAISGFVRFVEYISSSTHNSPCASTTN